MRPSLRILIGVYLLLSGGLYLATALLLKLDWDGLPGLAAAFGITCLLQAVFVTAAGSLRYLGRMSPWRLFLCTLFTSALLTAQGMGLGETLDELTHGSLPDESTSIKLLALAGVTVLWFLWQWCARQDRLVVVRRLVTVPIALAALQLPGLLWAYHVIMARPHSGFIDLTGLGTLMAILLDLLVLAWSFGPIFVWLYYRGARRQMRGLCPTCGYDLHGLSKQRCPECGRPFTLEEVRMSAEDLAIISPSTSAPFKDNS